MQKLAPTGRTGCENETAHTEQRYRFTEGLGSGLSPEILIFGIFISVKSFGGKNSASLNGSVFSVTSVLMTSPSPRLTWVRSGYPGKSR